MVAGAWGSDQSLRRCPGSRSAAESLALVVSLGRSLGFRLWLCLCRRRRKRFRRINLGHVPVGEQTLISKGTLFASHQLWAWWIVVLWARSTFAALFLVVELIFENDPTTYKLPFPSKRSLSTRPSADPPQPLIVSPSQPLRAVMCF